MKPNDVVSHFKRKYEKFTKSMAESKEKGYEVFLPLDLSHTMRDVIAFADIFYEDEKWDEILASRFDSGATTAMNRIEELLGLRRRKWLITLL